MAKKTTAEKFKNALQYIYLGVFLIPLVWNPWGSNDPYETAKTSWFLAFTILALAYFSFAVWRKQIVLKLNAALVLFCGLWLASFAISTIFSVSPIESFWGSYGRFQGLFIYIAYAIHFFVCLQLFQKENFRRTFFAIALLAGFLVSIHAIAQGLGLELLVRKPEGLFSGRSFATMGSPAFLGQFLIFPWCIAFFAMAARMQEKRWGRSALFAFLLIIFSAALFFTYNRASMLGFAVAVLAWTCLRFRRIAVAAIILLIIAAGAFLAFNPKFTTMRSLGSRAVLWEAALRVAPQYPLIGSGPETTYQTLQKTIGPMLYRYERMLDIPDRTHNVFLETLLTRGIPGIAILIAAILWILKLALKKKLFARQNAAKKTLFEETCFFVMLAFLISMQFSFSMITHAIFLLGITAIFFCKTAPQKLYKIKLPVAIKCVATIILIAVIYLFSVPAYKFTKAEFDITRATEAFLYNRPEAAALFDKTWREIPYFREFPYMAFFFFFENAAKNPAVMPYVEAAQRQIEKVTNNGFYGPLTKAQLAAAKKDYATAWIAFSEAARLAPNWPAVWYKWGNAALAAGDTNLAREKFQKFWTFVPKYNPDEKEKERIFRISNPTPFEVEQILRSLF